MPVTSDQISAETEGDDTRTPIRRDVPLVPRDIIAARALVTVIAIMTFLASLTVGSAILINDVSSMWRQEVAREVTIQIKPVSGRNIEQDLKSAEDLARMVAGIGDIRTLTKSESERLLEPWLGLGLDLSELPVPRMLVLRLRSGQIADLEKLRINLKQAVPNSSLDDHKAWVERLTTMSRTTALIASVIFGLVLIAMALAVAFATRGAMAGSREVINVLHFVGAEDSYIAHQFQKHFFWLGLQGGLIGGASAIAAFLIPGLFLSSAIYAADQIGSLFGPFALGFKGYLAIILISGSVALLTGFTSRSVVFRHLQGLE